MIPHTPPFVLERALAALLPARDREAIAGDLREAYADLESERGTRAANSWYLRQLLSLAPRALLHAAPVGFVLACICAFTALCGTWLGAMDIILRHPHIAGHELIAGIIVVQAILTLTTLSFQRLPALRPVVAAGCFALSVLAAIAIHGVLTDPHFEGYILLIALALILQAALTLLAFARGASSGGDPIRS